MTETCARGMHAFERRVPALIAQACQFPFFAFCWTGGIVNDRILMWGDKRHSFCWLPSSFNVMTSAAGENGVVKCKKSIFNFTLDK